MTAKGVVTLQTVVKHQRKTLQWQSMQTGRVVKRMMRVRSKTVSSGEIWEQFVLAGGSVERVRLWVVNTTTSTDHRIVWRAYNSSFCKLVDVDDITYVRVRNNENQE